MIRTVRTWYRAQFDLEKEVRVRISTVLKGACTNGTELKSTFTEMVLQPNNTGEVRRTICFCRYGVVWFGLNDTNSLTERGRDFFPLIILYIGNFQ